MPDEEIGVVGAGLMGTDIAALMSNARYEVKLIDVDENALRKARKSHEGKSLEALGRAGLKKRDEIISSIEYSSNLEKLEESFFVVEAISEKLESKIRLMESLEEILNEETVVGTNTSTLTPTDISKGVNFRERVVLFHFVNPAIHRKLIEISGDVATEKAIKTALGVGKKIGREPIILKKERRGHVLSRLSAAIKCSASWELLEAEPASIDRNAKSLGFQRGPIELIDLIGIDVHLETVTNLSQVYGDHFKPPKEIKNKMSKMADSGKLGRKTNEGFYKWKNGEPIIPKVEEEHDITPVIAALVNEAYFILEGNITDQETINRIFKLGSGGSTGPFDVREMMGKEEILESLKRRYRETGADIFKPADSLVE